MFLEREILVINNEALGTRNVKVSVKVINTCTNPAWIICCILTITRITVQNRGQKLYWQKLCAEMHY
jgi:hypothetical protein